MSKIILHIIECPNFEKKSRLIFQDGGGMKDKLYSRWRITIPNLREIKSFKIILLIAFCTIIMSLLVFLRSAYPVFRSSCETAASSKGTKIINEEVNKVMKNYSYDELVNIEKDTQGKISLIKANVITLNEIVSQIISNIQTQFDKIPRISVFINMGSVSGISVLKNLEPQFELELESAGKISSNVKTEFKSVGINQTEHKIYLQIDARVGILTPFETFGKDIKTDVILTEAIIVGEVPDSYYNLDGMENQDDTFNFIE